MRPITRARHAWHRACREQLWYLGGPASSAVLLVMLSAAALFRGTYEIQRLVSSSGRLAAVDLRHRFEEVRAWFSGEPVYDLFTEAIYPPATYAILWPLMGYGSWQFVRWLWLVSSVAALVVFIRISLARYGLSHPWERIFWTMFVLGHYATGVVIGNGQLTIHVLAATTVCIALLPPLRQGGGSAAATGVFAALSLVKPSISAPFMWLVMVRSGKALTGILAAGVLYLGFAVMASMFQPQGLVALHKQWLAHVVPKAATMSAPIAEYGDGVRAAPDSGYGDLNNLFALLGHGDMAFPAALLVFLLLGGLVYHLRSVDPWILAGVVAIVARIWTYHRVYDDMLILLAVFAVVAVVKARTGDWREKAGRILLSVLVVCSIVPASLRLLAPPWDMLFKLGQLTLWTATLAYLVFALYQSRSVHN